MARKLEVEIIGDAASLERALGRSANATGKFGSSMDGLARSAKIAGLALVAGLGVAAKIGFDEMVEAEKVTAQTGAALESTGHAANVTGKQIEKLAGALSQMSGVDDEVIQAGENMLLTFTKVRNEVGAGNDIFNQATKASLNLSVALGKDLPSSAMLVGKALNDPIKGMTAMTRAGIQFTDQQKDMIKALVESGDVMGAQKIILKELETQFGGSAAAAGDTLAGQINKAKNAFAEMSASIMVALMPAMLVVASAVQRLSAYFQEHETAAKVAAGGVVGLTVAVWALNFALSANPVVLTIVGLAAFAAILVVAWQASETARKVIIALGLVFMALPTAIALAWHASETFRTVVRAALAAVMVAANFLKSSVDEVVAVFHALQSAGAAVAGFLTSVFRPAVGVATTVVNGLDAALDAVRTVLGGIRTAAGAVAAYYQGNFLTALNAARVVVTAVTRVVESLAAALWSVVGAANAVASAIRSIPDMPRIGIPGLPGIGIGGRATGGPVSAGGLYMVGERGPELFSPRASGSIIPNNKLGGGVTYQFVFPNYIGNERDLEQALVAANARVRARGGLS